MDHFIPLVKVLKSKARIDWADIIQWYGEHYYMLTKDNEHNPRYVAAIAELLVKYIDGLSEEGRKLVSLPEMVKRLSPDHAWKVKFYDLDDADPKIGGYHYRVIAECCSILMMTIPARVWGEDYKKLFVDTL